MWLFFLYFFLVSINTFKDPNNNESTWNIVVLREIEKFMNKLNTNPLREDDGMLNDIPLLLCCYKRQISNPFFLI